MRDPTSEIEEGLIALLDNNLSYESNNYPVITNRSKSKQYRYVLIDNVELVDSSTASSSLTEAEVTIEIVSGGYLHKSANTVVNSISDQLMQLLAYNSISMTNFTQSIRPYLLNSTMLTEETENDIIKRKILTFKLGVYEA
jgi:hypothetical protein